MKEWQFVESVVESTKNRDLGIKSLIFIKQAFLKDDVVEFRESVDDDGNVEPYTYVLTTNGEMCINMRFSDFAKLMTGNDSKAEL